MQYTRYALLFIDYTLQASLHAPGEECALRKSEYTVLQYRVNFAVPKAQKMNTKEENGNIRHYRNAIRDEDESWR